MQPAVRFPGSDLMPVPPVSARSFPLESAALGSSSPPPLSAGVQTEKVQSWIRPGDLNSWTRWHVLLLSEDGNTTRGILTDVSGKNFF